MLPRLFSINWGNLVFHLNGYGFSIFCGTLAALLISLRRARESSLPLQRLLPAFLIAVAGGFSGSKIAFALQYGRLPFPGGWVLYGGLLGGLAAAWAACRRYGLPLLSVADLAAPCVLLAAAFGRLGCFFAGCCYGAVWDGGVTYPALSRAWKSHRAAGLLAPDSLRSLPTVPAPLLESGALLAIFVATSLIWRRGGKPGRTLAACGLLYSAWRFGAEFWRGDHSAYWGATLTFSQGISLAVFAASLALLFAGAERTRDRVASKFGWIAASQAAVLLIGVFALTGGIGCSRGEPRKVGDKLTEEAGDVVGDCIGDCISDCTNACIEDCTRKNCDENGSPTPPDAEGASKNVSPALRLPRLEPGSRHTGRLTLQGTLNERLTLLLQLAGELEVLSKDAAGALQLRVQVTEFQLQLGALSVSSPAGEMAVRIDAKGHASIRSATLSDEIMSVLKAIEPLSRGLLQVDVNVAPAKGWAALIEGELGVPDPRGECRGHLVLNDQSSPFEASAMVTRTAEGEKRVQWLLRK